MPEINNSFFDSLPKTSDSPDVKTTKTSDVPDVKTTTTGKESPLFEPIPEEIPINNPNVIRPASATQIKENPLANKVYELHGLDAIKTQDPNPQKELNKTPERIVNKLETSDDSDVKKEDIDFENSYEPDAPLPEPTKKETEEESESEEKSAPEEIEETELEKRAIKGQTMDSYYNEMKETIDKKREEMGLNSGAKKLSDDELELAIEETTSHFKIIEGFTPDGRKAGFIKPGDIPKQNYNESDIIFEKDYDSLDFEKIKNFSERTIFDGNRRVQVVCVQSGYSCMVGAMNSRELETFGRSEGADTYSRLYEMYSSIFRKCSNFSCGNVTFQQFMNMTAHPDVETLLFGLYNATFPGSNKYTIYCDNCGKEFVFPVDNHSLLQVAPGSVTMKTIKDFLSGTFTDSRAMMKMAKRFKGKVWYSANNTIYFKIGVPSISKFIENAYHNKKQEIINRYESDMVYSGYVISVGLLNMEEYLNSGKLQWIESSAIENIDRAISKLSADDKSSFVSCVNSYVQENTVTYQVPILTCPHCRKPTRQKAIPLRELFFAIRDQKEMGL